MSDMHFGGPIDSPVADLSLKYHCDLSCRWATLRPSCFREAGDLLSYFREHGRFSIALPEYAHNYPRCPLFELVPLREVRGGG